MKYETYSYDLFLIAMNWEIWRGFGLLLHECSRKHASEKLSSAQLTVLKGTRITSSTK